jgi:hypothetical protein
MLTKTKHMNPYTFTMTRTYETIIEIEADNYEEAVQKLSETDVYAIELEQCCVTDEIVFHDCMTVSDINWKH